MENEPVILKLLRFLLRIVGYACIAFIVVPYGLLLASKVRCAVRPRTRRH